ncbi:hypothetical protein C8F04DRAFT_599146 [Mycena alexandri]|uniref:Uncharacterized protein n=1 Tax=Mycena alexandri TaxID=1745969 RepID=A0AAD6XE12_9AGAR|nr:hypothetical protein C8F04DRAFT_599146 [Mycena alexandri]
MRIVEPRTALGVLLGMLNSGVLLALQDRVIKGNTQIQDAVESGVNSLAQQLEPYQQQIAVVVRQVSRGVVEDLFVVISLAGVSIPVPLAYCSTYSDLTRILSAYFEGKAVLSKAPYWMIASAGDNLNIVAKHASNLVFASPSFLQLTASTELHLVLHPKDSRNDVWSSGRCARCGSPLGTQSLECQVRLNSRCESVVQLFDKIIRRLPHGGADPRLFTSMMSPVPRLFNKRGTVQQARYGRHHSTSC